MRTNGKINFIIWIKNIDRIVTTLLDAMNFDSKKFSRECLLIEAIKQQQNGDMLIS